MRLGDFVACRTSRSLGSKGRQHSGYCTDKVVSYGYGHAQRQTVECKAGEVKTVAHVEKAPAPEEAPK